EIVFQAGTKLSDGKIVTNGGRVFGVTAIGNTLSQAGRLAYKALKKIYFRGMYFRKDIGAAE
ncbi:MAG: phosphoribosylamine--glycine ligase, partial [Candidatus Portnoybacteria bacterium]|nr:phosphoribosylamine--glycine ligase [Candidatus Portnoybacteria bacterium]